MCIENLHDCREFMCMYVSFCNSVLTYLAVMCIYVIYKRLSWDSNKQRDLGKPSERNSHAKLSMGSC
jgi:hypothetical protein